jgi:hypothetical protein
MSGVHCTSPSPPLKDAGHFCCLAAHARFVQLPPQLCNPSRLCYCLCSRLRASLISHSPPLAP